MAEAKPSESAEEQKLKEDQKRAGTENKPTPEDGATIGQAAQSNVDLIKEETVKITTKTKNDVVNFVSSGMKLSRTDTELFLSNIKTSDTMGLKLSEISETDYKELSDEQKKSWDAVYSTTDSKSEWEIYQKNMGNFVKIMEGRLINFNEAFKSYLPKDLKKSLENKTTTLTEEDLKGLAEAFNELAARGGDAKEPSTWKKAWGKFTDFADFILNNKISWSIISSFGLYCFALSVMGCSKDVFNSPDIPNCILNNTGCGVGKMFSGCYLVSPDGTQGKLIYSGSTDLAPSSSSDTGYDDDDGGGIDNTCTTNKNCDCDGNTKDADKCSGCSGVVTSGEYMGWSKIWMCKSFEDAIPDIISGGSKWVSGSFTKILIIILISFLVFGLIVFIWRWATKPKSKDSNSKFKFRKRKKYKRIKK